MCIFQLFSPLMFNPMRNVFMLRLFLIFVLRFHAHLTLIIWNHKNAIKQCCAQFSGLPPWKMYYFLHLSFLFVSLLHIFPFQVCPYELCIISFIFHFCLFLCCTFPLFRFVPMNNVLFPSSFIFVCFFVVHFLLSGLPPWKMAAVVAQGSRIIF